MRLNLTVLLFAAIALIGLDTACAQNRAKSPRGEASTQIGEAWITVDYGRPILRGRQGIFGSGENYGAKLSANAPVWRVGANKSTRFNTEADLMFGDKKLPAGEYSMFIELKPEQWTLIFSNHAAKDSGRESGDGLWGSYNYTADKDVIRVPMSVNTIDMSVDQFTIGFFDVSSSGGTLGVIWDNVMGATNFSL